MTDSTPTSVPKRHPQQQVSKSPSTRKPVGPVRKALRWAAWPLLIYVLSIGPMYWQWYGAMYAGDSIFWLRFYTPLMLIASIPGIGDIIQWYIGLWIL